VYRSWSSYPFQRVFEEASPFCITVRDARKPGDIVLGQRAYRACRGADDEGIIGKFLAFRDQRTGADQAVFADFCAVQDDGLYADQRTFANRAAVDHGLMADTDVVAYRQRKAGVGMQYDAFLQIAVAADRDVFVVAAHADLKPQAGIESIPAKSYERPACKGIILRYSHGSQPVSVILQKQSKAETGKMGPATENCLKKQCLFTSCYGANGTLAIETWSDGKIACLAIKSTKND
jgi:hypothetical protein